MLTTLLTHDGLEVPAIIVFYGRKLPYTGEKEEVLVYTHNRLVKGLLEDDYVAELEVLVEWCIIPEWEEQLKEL